MKKLNVEKLKDLALVIMILVLMIVGIKIVLNNWNNDESINNNEFSKNKYEKFEFVEKIEGGFIYKNEIGETVFIDSNDASAYKIYKKVKIKFDENGYEIKVIENE